MRSGMPRNASPNLSSASSPVLRTSMARSRCSWRRSIPWWRPRPEAMIPSSRPLSRREASFSPTTAVSGRGSDWPVSPCFTSVPGPIWCSKSVNDPGGFFFKKSGNDFDGAGLARTEVYSRTSTVLMTTSTRGLSFMLTLTLEILSTTSMPSSTVPNTGCA